MTERDLKAALQAVVDVFDERLRAVENRALTNLTISGRDLAPPVVHNQIDVPAADVNVVNNVEPTPINVTAPALDLAPLADVFERHLAAAQLFNAQLVEELREKNALLSQLVQTLAAQEPPTVKVPAPKVEVAAPSVTVQSPPARKRELKIVFDGDEATVKEV